MPACKILLVFLPLLLSTTIIQSQLQVPSSLTLAPSYSSSISKAILWISNNQSAIGYFGGGQYDEHWTAAAADALWLDNSSSARAHAAFTWVSSSLSTSSSWYWDSSYGEADVPGAILYSLAIANQTSGLANSGVSAMLLHFQNSTTGGFRGYADPNQGYAQVTSSVDTSFALLGLAKSGLVSHDRILNATSYLFTLHNADGSFRLTDTTLNSASDALGPDQIATTALATLALGEASVSSTTPDVSSAIQFLANHVTTQDLAGHVYAASLTALALNEFNQTSDANRALGFIISEQNSDGGFKDGSRTSPGSNAFDTGWATIALQTVRPNSQSQTTQPGPQQPSPSGQPLSSYVFVIAVLAVGMITVLSIVAFAVTRKRPNQS